MGWLVIVDTDVKKFGIADVLENHLAATNSVAYPSRWRKSVVDIKKNNGILNWALVERNDRSWRKSWNRHDRGLDLV